MSRELFWLTVTVVMTGLLWVPYILNRFVKWGILATLDNPKRDNPRHSLWAIRMMAAHENAIENLVIFATLVLVASQLGISTPITVWACIAYFWARLLHVVVYTLGVPYLRTVAFTVAFLAQAAIAIEIFRQVQFLGP